MPRRLLMLSLGAELLIAAGCGDREPQPGDRPFGGTAAADDSPQHVHGLGINPADGALYIATHTGLWRTAPSGRRAQRIGDDIVRAQPEAFAAHREDLYAAVHGGEVLASTDGGQSWQTRVTP